MSTTQNKISELKDRENSNSDKPYNKLSDGIAEQKKDYELVFTVRKRHLRP